jgi:hypothetical protein
MGWLSDVFKFEGSHLSDMWGDIKDDPERLLVGAIEPASTSVWNKVLGKDWDPLVDQMGGATSERYSSAESKGIDTSAGRGMQNVAHAVAGLFAGNYGANSLGFGGGAPSQGGYVPTSADKASLFGETGYGQGMSGAETGPAGGANLGFDYGRFGSQLQDFGRITQAAGGQQQERPMPRPVDTSAQQAIIQQMIQQLQQRGGG